MCGIFGHNQVVQEGLDRSRRALHMLTHRGPDQWGEWYDDDFYFGHRRLSILDLSDHARQPMMTEDQQVIITANGEIYNFQELKEELQKSCHFQSNSDSEVLLHGYKSWGIDTLLEKIDGMYSFSIYDRVNKKLFLVRDRVGIKPLFFAHIGNRIAWASELKAIKSYFGEDNLRVDNTAIYDYLTYNYIPSPKTMYQDIFKLEAAHYLEIDAINNDIKKHCYWQLEVKEKPISADHAAVALRALISQSVKEQMVSDVPVGFFLSGGLDSSTVVAEATKLSESIHTYTIGFNDSCRDETGFAEMVSRFFHTNHKTNIFEQTFHLEMLEKLDQWYDEPFGDMSAFPTSFVSAFARETSTVVLTGDGGDEVFGGYNWYYIYKRFSGFRIPASSALKPLVRSIKKLCKKCILGKIATRLELFLLQDLELYTKCMNGMLKIDKQKYAKMFQIPDDYDDYWHFRKYYRDDLPLLTRLQYLDFHTYLPDDILTKVDRVSMFVSLEARVPLLSKELIEFSFSLPEEIRYYEGNLKGLLKYAYKDILPQEIIERSKKGFSPPPSSIAEFTSANDLTLQEQLLGKLYGGLLKQ